jgi:hypothetical protein
MAPASTIWPFVDSFNSMARKSYLRMYQTAGGFGGNNPDVISIGTAQVYAG